MVNSSAKPPATAPGSLGIAQEIPGSKKYDLQVLLAHELNALPVYAVFVGQANLSAGEVSLEWTPRRSSIDPASFDCGRVGPYTLGPVVRTGLHGPVHLALGAQFDFILELERVEIGGLFDPDGLGPRLLDRLNHCVGARHRHVSTLLGAGMDSGQPYLLRPHILGRTLQHLLEGGTMLPLDVAAGVLFSTAEALQFLQNLGPSPGSCSVGGLCERSIHLGWDGGIRVLGAGLGFIRNRSLNADFESWKGLVQRLDRSLVGSCSSWEEAIRLVRTERREACAGRRAAVGSWLRRVDKDGCVAYRRLFGLPTLQ